VTLVFAVALVIVRRDNVLPFGPGLAAGSVITWLGWRWVVPHVQALFFNEWILSVVVGGGAAFMLLASVFLRLIRGPEPSEVPS